LVVGGWTGYAPYAPVVPIKSVPISGTELGRVKLYRLHPGDIIFTPHQGGICGELQATIPKTPTPLQPYLERTIRRACP
jgi:hypothetical protein